MSVSSVGRRRPEDRWNTVRPRPSALTTVAWRALVAVVAFDALSAVGGAVGMMLTNGLGMPLTMLQASPFTSFLVPAIVLLIVVGGTHVLALVLLLRGRRSSLLWSAFAGFGMVIWILVEIVIIRAFNALHALYFVAGVAELALVLALLGIVSWLPRIELPRHEARVPVTGGGAE